MQLLICQDKTKLVESSLMHQVQYVLLDSPGIKITCNINYNQVSGHYLHHLMDVAFRSSKFCWVFYFDEDNEEKIVPHIVLSSDMLLKCDILVVKCLQ